MSFATVGHLSYLRKGLLILAILMILSYVVLFFQQSLTTIPNYFEYHAPFEQFINKLDSSPDYRKTGLNFQPSNPETPPYNTTVLKLLNKHFPYDPSLPIPKQVWQMWKVDTKHVEFPDAFRGYRKTWTDLSPEYKYILKTNAECDAMVETLYSDIPDIVHAYNIMPQTILKCDFSRYLILFAYGGIYADMDTRLLKPIGEWFSSQAEYLNKTLDLGLVVGIEADMKNWQQYYTRRIQINTWTIIVRKRHPMLADLISRITEETLRREEAKTLKTVLAKNAQDDVINWTGPGKFTDSVFNYLNNILQPSFGHYERIIDAEFFVNVKRPITIADAMVLPMECLNSGKKHLRTNLDDPFAYIQHVGSGVWKKQGGEVNTSQ